MSAPAVLTLLCGVVALCTAAFNLLFFGFRRRERAYLWLAVAAAAGIAPIALLVALQYGSTSAWEAAWLRTAQLSCSLVIAVAISNFLENYLRVPLGWIKPTLVGGVALMIPLAWLPGVGFTFEPVVRQVPPFDHSYIDTAISPLLGAAGLPLLVGVLGVVRHVRRHMPEVGSGGTWLTITGTIFALTASFDVGVGSDRVQGPYLMVFGADVFALAFTALLVRRLAASRALVEAGAERLQTLAERQLEEIRDRERQLAHGDRLATVGTLAAGVAHEINNPLAFVSANMNQLEELAKEPEAEDARELFDEILVETREGLTRIAGTVDDLLAMSRREEGSTAPVDLKKVVEASLPLARHEARGQVRIVTTLGKTAPVLGDARLLGQVVLNLVVNAIHAIPADRPSGGQVQVGLSQQGEEVVLSVTDDGPGIADDVRARMFDAFFTTKPSGRGTGLGLAVSQEVVKRHGGRIEIEDAVPGTRFVVRLPAGQDEEEAQTPGFRARVRRVTEGAPAA